MARSYDVVVVGARCAGSPTAMLLARQGYSVLLVDRAHFPSDTVSTHVIHPPGVAALDRWGLLSRLVDTGVPPIDRYSFDFGAFTIAGSPAIPEAPVAYCPRRTVLDELLVQAAAEAGAEVREGFTVTGVLTEGGQVAGVRGHRGGGAEVTERAQVVVGADGHRSVVARAVDAACYHERPRLLVNYYSYWSGLPAHGRFATWIRQERGWAIAPTHDGLTLLVGGWPYREFEAHKSDVEATFLQALEQEPEMAERVRAARRESRWAGMPVPNLFRVPFGPGWALVGDAGYVKDPLTAQGITDAFLAAEACSTALHQALRGERPYAEALADYHRSRDRRALPMFEFTCELASMEPPSPEQQQLLAAIAGNPGAADDFVRMNAGVLSPAEFLAPENVGLLLSGAARGS